MSIARIVGSNLCDAAQSVAARRPQVSPPKPSVTSPDVFLQVPPRNRPLQTTSSGSLVLPPPVPMQQLRSGSVLPSVPVERLEGAAPVRRFVETGKELGRGAFGCVVEVKDEASGELFARKVVKKQPWKVGNEKQIARELEILQHPSVRDCPFLVHAEDIEEVRDSKTQKTSAYNITMKKYDGGEFFDTFVDLVNQGDFLPPRLLSTDAVRFVMAELVVALEALHQASIVHRDLKFENILVDAEGHLAVTDFGLSRFLPGGPGDKMRTGCGTLSYVAPEVLKSVGYGKEADLWTLGVLLYVTQYGYPPFNAEQTGVLINDICKGHWSIPYAHRGDFPATEELLDNLLEVDPAQRWTLDAVKSSSFFAGIDWDVVKARGLTPPPEFVPAT